MDTTVVNDYFTAFHECEKAVRQKKKKKKKRRSKTCVFGDLYSNISGIWCSILRTNISLEKTFYYPTSAVAAVSNFVTFFFYDGDSIIYFLE